MEPRGDSGPEGAISAARAALEKGDLPKATRHVASALAEDPNRSEWLGLLDEIIEAADDPDELIPDDDLPTPSSLAAVRAYIRANQGRVVDAIHQILEVVSERPDILYFDWALGWLQRPEINGLLDLEKVSTFLGSLIEQLPALTSAHGGGQETLARLPIFVQVVRRTQPANAQFLTASAGLLGRLGHRDEALRLAREAEALEPDYHSAVTRASIHAARDEVDQALEAFRDALRHEPGDLPARIGMADLLAHHGRVKEAKEMFAEVLEREPEQETALPSYYFLQFTGEGEESWRDKLLAYAEGHPENDRARRLAQQVTAFVGYLPDPTDLVASLRRPPENKPGRPRLELQYLIAPSNYLANDGLRDAEGHPRTMLSIYVEMARRISKMKALPFFQRYGEVARALGHLGEPIESAAEQVFRLYQRHAQEVMRVVSAAIADYRIAIADGLLAPPADWCAWFAIGGPAPRCPRPFSRPATPFSAPGSAGPSALRARRRGPTFPTWGSTTCASWSSAPGDRGRPTPFRRNCCADRERRAGTSPGRRPSRTRNGRLRSGRATIRSWTGRAGVGSRCVGTRSGKKWPS